MEDRNLQFGKNKSQVGYQQMKNDELEMSSLDQPEQSHLFLLKKPITFSNKEKMITIASLLLAVLIIALIVVLATRNGEGDQQNKWIDIKSQINLKENDMANYEYTQLQENGLRILLITQKNVKLSAAALDVRVGSMNNPDNFQGLAHLLEHMLFMGSQKYPQEDTFGTIVSQSGGQTNAFTSSGNTNYFFQGSQKNFLEILEVWSRFFVDPLLKEDQLNREVDAVESEYVNTLTRSEFRLENLKVALSERGHPYKIFSCGNRDSLINEPKKMNLSSYAGLHSFFRRYYYAENMFLVLKTEESYREELKQEIIKIFSLIPNRNENYKEYTHFDEQLTHVSKKQTDQPPIQSPIHSVLLETNPQKKLVLSFFMPTGDNEKATSLQFIADLFEFGYDQNNFCHFLENNYLASDCTFVIQSEKSTLNSFLTFEIQLIPQNEDDINQIIQTYFYFMKQLANYPDKSIVYDKFAQLKLSLFNLFDTAIPSEPMDEVSIYAMIINTNRTKDIQSSESLYGKYNATHVDQLLQILTDPTKLLSVHITDKQVYTQDQPLLFDSRNHLQYTRKYRTIEEAQLLLDQPQNIVLPLLKPLKVIPVITDPFILKPANQKPNDVFVQLIHSSPKGRIFIQRDTSTFLKPLQSFYLQFCVEGQTPSSEATVASLKILATYLELSLRIKTHSLQLTGLQISVDPLPTQNGFVINIISLDSQLEQVILHIHNSLSSITSVLLANIDEFSSSKRLLIDSIHKFQSSMLFFQVKDIVNSFLYPNVYSSGEILSSLDSLTFDLAKTLIKAFLEQKSLTLFAFGDIEDTTVKNIFDRLTASSSRTQPMDFSVKFINLAGQSVILQEVYNSGDKLNNLCTNYYQLGQLSLEGVAILEMMAKSLKNKAMQYLRTERQLGYIATSQIINNSSIYGLFIHVQGSHHSPHKVDGLIEDFLQYFELYLNDLTPDDISSMQQSLLHSIQKSFTQFSDKAQDSWSIIQTGSQNLTQRNEILNLLTSQTFTAQQCLQFFMDHIKNKNRRFSFELYSPTNSDAANLPIKNSNKSSYNGGSGQYISSKKELLSLNLAYFTLNTD